MKFSVDKRDAGTRIDIYLTKKISKFTRSFLKKIILTKNLKINNTVVSSPSTKIKTKDIIFINILSRNENRLIPKKIKTDIVYEDNDILIINKPKGMVVHPGAGNVENTLANALAFETSALISLSVLAAAGLSTLFKRGCSFDIACVNKSSIPFSPILFSNAKKLSKLIFLGT